MRYSKNGYLAIQQPQFKKIESTMKGGLAVAMQRTEMISVPLVMAYKLDGQLLEPGWHEVILRGDAGLAQWAKQVFVVDNQEFVLCPESAIIGYKDVATEVRITTGISDAGSGGTGNGVRG